MVDAVLEVAWPRRPAGSSSLDGRPRDQSTACRPYHAASMTSAGDRPSTHHHTNRLAGETSPYLLQHAHNPVDWYPWGDEALERARAEAKPIFLSIGYAACHWCHVMERESFEDEATAAELNARLRGHQGRPRGAPRPRRRSTWTRCRP